LFVLKIVCDEDRDNYKGKKNKDKICEAIYFDSFGIDMPIEVANYLKTLDPLRIVTGTFRISIVTSADGIVCSLIMP